MKKISIEIDESRYSEQKMYSIYDFDDLVIDISLDEEGEYWADINKPILLLIQVSEKMTYEYDSLYSLGGIYFDVLKVGHLGDLESFKEEAARLSGEEHPKTDGLRHFGYSRFLVTSRTLSINEVY